MDESPWKRKGLKINLSLVNVQVAGCEFTARNSSTLQKHVRKIHELITDPLYECHACLIRFHNASTLKIHLRSVHSITPQPGNIRFKYETKFICLFLVIIYFTIFLFLGIWRDLTEYFVWKTPLLHRQNLFPVKKEMFSHTSHSCTML